MLSADGSTGAEPHGITKETIKTAYILNLLVIMWICLIDIIEIKMLKQFNLKKKTSFWHIIRMYQGIYPGMYDFQVQVQIQVMNVVLNIYCNVDDVNKNDGECIGIMFD